MKTKLTVLLLPTDDCEPHGRIVVALERATTKQRRNVSDVHRRAADGDAVKDAMARHRTSGTAPRRGADAGIAVKDATAKRVPGGTAPRRRADAGIAVKDAAAKRQTNGTATRRRADAGIAVEDAAAKRQPSGSVTRRRADAGIAVKRVYEPADDADGYRSLVERLWSRGLSKMQLWLDAWHKEIAPIISNGTENWFVPEVPAGIDCVHGYQYVSPDKIRFCSETCSLLSSCGASFQILFECAGETLFP